MKLRAISADQTGIREVTQIWQMLSTRIFLLNRAHKVHGAPTLAARFHS